MGTERKGTMMNELDYTKAQLLFFYIIILLSVDLINPVKIFVHVFPAIYPWHIAALSGACWIYTFIVNMRPLLYYASKIFFHSILSIFFNDIQIVGLSNIPAYGPVIFTSNHANQFMDGLMILCTCQRTISYLIAEKSWNRPIIGHLAWALGAVPVKRAQDNVSKGTGKVMVNSEEVCETDITIEVVGKGTKFTSEVKSGDKIRLPGTSLGIKVVSVDDDSTLSLKVETGVIDVVKSQPFPEPVSFDVLPRVDQANTYRSVLEKLSTGGTVGIFPEGGSHDRTDLLPLKVGVAIIAYSELEKDGVNVPIVPVGLNYFRAHRFRGKATVEFGSPTYIDTKTLDDYKRGGADKRKVCNELLGRIEHSMRSVIVSVPDYETMQTIHAARRLYREDGVVQSAQDRQDMGRRFAEGYKRMLLQTKGDPPKEWKVLQDRLLAYQKELDGLGIRDYQVVGLDHEQYELGSETEGHTKVETFLYRLNVFGHIVHLVLISTLACLPSLLLNLPVGLVARKYANYKRKKALAASKVKVLGYDVVLSERVVCSIVLVPTLWVIYGLALVVFTDFDWPTLAVCFTCFPLFSYWGVHAAESGMVDVKDLRPYVMKMIPSARKRLAALPATRKALRDDLRAQIRKIGPSLGNLYFDKELNWAEITRETSRMSVAAAEEKGDAKKEK